MNKRLTLFMAQTFLQPQTDWGFKVNIQDNNSCAGGGSASTAIATANVAKTIDNCKRNAVFRSKNDEFLRFSAIMYTLCLHFRRNDRMLIKTPSAARQKAKRGQAYPLQLQAILQKAANRTAKGRKTRCKRPQIATRKAVNRNAKDGLLQQHNYLTDSQPVTDATRFGPPLTFKVSEPHIGKTAKTTLILLGKTAKNSYFCIEKNGQRNVK